MNPADILLKDELDELAKSHPERFTVYYVLNNPADSWAGGVGFVTTDMIRTHLPAPGDGKKMLLCGPPPMMTAMKKCLDDLQWEKPRTISKRDDPVFVF